MQDEDLILDRTVDPADESHPEESGWYAPTAEAEAYLVGPGAA